MMNKKNYMEINGLTLTNYFYRLMEKLCTPIHLVNGIKLILNL